MKIAIVGMGRVGSCLANNLGVLEVVDTIYAIGRNQEYLQAQVGDITDSLTISESKTRIIASDYKAVKDADIVVITAAAKVRVAQDRLSSFETNKQITEQIVEACEHNGFKGLYIVASNPVDVLTAVVSKRTAKERAIGSGTILDNARFKIEIAKSLNIDVKQIESNAIGEHGTSISLLFDSVLVDNINLRDYLNNHNLEIDENKIFETVIKKGPTIYNQKGATEFGIASSLTKIIKAIKNNTGEYLLITSVDQVPGVGEVFIPNLYKVASGFAKQNIELTESEQDQYIKSAKRLKSYEDKI